MTDEGPDLHQTANGEWEPYYVFQDDEDISDVEEALKSLGWSPFMHLGSVDYLGFEINVYDRQPGNGHPEYLLDVWGGEHSSPYVKVDNLPKVMELRAQWAPITQAATISRVARELTAGIIEYEGLVENIAARVAWGVQERLPKLKKYRDQWDADAESRRREARKTKP